MRRSEQPVTDDITPSLNQFISRAKNAKKTGDYSQAIYAYERAIDILINQCPPKKKIQHRAVWYKLASLYIRTERHEDARLLYHAHLIDLQSGGSISRLNRAILESFNVEGVDFTPCHSDQRQGLTAKP
jgi:tetratricopeptide (TPR) repeat protein